MGRGGGAYECDSYVELIITRSHHFAFVPIMSAPMLGAVTEWGAVGNVNLEISMHRRYQLCSAEAVLFSAESL